VTTQNPQPVGCTDSAGAAAAPPAARPRFFLRLRWLLQWTVNAAVVILVILLMPPVHYWLARQLVTVDQPAAADYIVILGGSAERVMEGAQLYREGYAPKIIVSSSGDDADRLARMLRGLGVPEGAILLDGKAYRTWSHPASIAALPGVSKELDRFLVVTSPYHTSRALACFRRQGYPHVTVLAPRWRPPGNPPARYWDFAESFRDLPEEMHEVAAWAAYSLMGWL
jgi:uncharacterized SAM-binding protein YcdF (DUF218 family)